MQSLLKKKFHLTTLALIALLFAFPQEGLAKRKKLKKINLTLVVRDECAIRVKRGRKLRNGLNRVPKKLRLQVKATDKGYMPALMINGEYVAKYNQTQSLNDSDVLAGRKKRRKKPTIIYRTTAAEIENQVLQAVCVPQEQSFLQTLTVGLKGLGASIKISNQSPGTFNGTAESNLGISQVSWTNLSNNSSGTASGTDSWTASIPFVNGDNNLKFVATATDGTTQDFKTKVTYNPSITFTSSLELSKEVAYIGEETEVRATIGVPNAPSSVTLYKADSNGNLGDAVVQLKDDGVLPDEIQSDGIFSGEFKYTPETKQIQNYRVKVEGSGTYVSEIFPVYETNRFTKAQIKAAVDKVNYMKTLYDAALLQKKSKWDAAQSVKEYLDSDPNTAAVMISPAGDVSTITKEGIPLTLIPDLWESHSKRSAPSDAIARQNTPSVRPNQGVNNVNYYSDAELYLSGLAGNLPSENMAEEKDPNEIDSNACALISPYYWKFQTKDDMHGYGEALTNNGSACNCWLSYKKLGQQPSDIPLEDFKSLGRFAVVDFSTHGGIGFYDIAKVWDSSSWGPSEWFNGSKSVPIMLSDLRLPSNLAGEFDISLYEDYLQTGKLVVTQYAVLGITPSFVFEEMGPFNNAIILANYCRSTYDNAMANAFLRAGAGAYIGFDNYVDSEYARDLSGTFMSAMLSGKTAIEAYNEALLSLSPTDGKSPAAFYQFKAGNGNLKLGKGNLANESFESGLLRVWEAVGDGRVIAQLGNTKPTDGDYMGIISTGLGYTTSAGSIKQLVCLVSKDVSSLSFDWNFFSEEFLEYCDSKYQDYFEVEICEMDGTSSEPDESACTTHFRKIIDELCSDVSPVDVDFDKGDVYATGWQSGETIDLTQYQGKNIRLSFIAGDVGDSIYDSAILIDNIEIK